MPLMMHPQLAAHSTTNSHFASAQLITYIAFYSSLDISAIIHKPKLLILDEPFSGLDPINVELFKKIILELQKEGTSINPDFMSTRSVDEDAEIQFPGSEN